MNDREIFGTFTERTRRVLGFAQQEALRLIITDEALKGGLVELPPSKTRPPIFSRKGSLIGLAFGITLAFVIVFILVGRPPGSRTGIGRSCAVITSVWQRITWKPPQAVSHTRGV